MDLPPLIHIPHLIGVGRCSQNLRQEHVGVKSDGRHQLLQLFRAERPSGCLLLISLISRRIRLCAVGLLRIRLGLRVTPLAIIRLLVRRVRSVGGALRPALSGWRRLLRNQLSLTERQQKERQAHQQSSMLPFENSIGAHPESNGSTIKSRSARCLSVRANDHVPSQPGVTGIEPLQLMILLQPKDHCPVRLEWSPSEPNQQAVIDAGGRAGTVGKPTTMRRQPSAQRRWLLRYGRSLLGLRQKSGVITAWTGCCTRN